MSPFIKSPDGFSAEALELLDGALNDMWLSALATDGSQAHPTADSPAASEGPTPGAKQTAAGSTRGRARRRSPL